MEEIAINTKVRVPRSLSVSNLLNKKYSKLTLSVKWEDFIGRPEDRGVWFIYGRSGQGKTSFMLQLAKELSQYGGVLFNSLEEGSSSTLQDAVIRENLPEVGSKIRFIEEVRDVFGERLSKKGSPCFVIIDSLKYFKFRNFDQYQLFINKHKDKLLIFTCPVPQKGGLKPLMEEILIAAGLKIWVEGYTAYSRGRFMGKTGKYVIWEEGAQNVSGFGNDTMVKIKNN